MQLKQPVPDKVPDGCPGPSPRDILIAGGGHGATIAPGPTAARYGSALEHAHRPANSDIGKGRQLLNAFGPQVKMVKFLIVISVLKL